MNQDSDSQQRAAAYPDPHGAPSQLPPSAPVPAQSSQYGPGEYGPGPYAPGQYAPGQYGPPPATPPVGQTPHTTHHPYSSPPGQHAPGQYAPGQYGPPPATPPVGQTPYPTFDQWQPPKPYYHALRRENGGNVWRGICALLAVGVAFFAFSIPASIVILLTSDIDFSSGGFQFDTSDLRMTPLGLLATNLGLAALWPASWLIERFIYGRPAQTLHSVARRFRWSLFFKLCAVLLPAYALYIATTNIWLPGGTSGAFTATSALFLVVILLTTPLQAAGEEVAFRGTIGRAVGGWFATPRVALVVGTIVSSILFAVAHGAGDMWLNAYYFVFGASMAAMTWRTQGLEAAIIAHAANNTFLMIVSAAMGMSFDDMFERSEGVGGPFMLIAMAMCAAAAALVWWRTGKGRLAKDLDLPEGITPSS